MSAACSCPRPTTCRLHNRPRREAPPSLLRRRSPVDGSRSVGRGHSTSGADCRDYPSESAAEPYARRPSAQAHERIPYNPSPEDEEGCERGANNGRAGRGCGDARREHAARSRTALPQGEPSDSVPPRPAHRVHPHPQDCRDDADQRPARQLPAGGVRSLGNVFHGAGGVDPGPVVKLRQSGPVVTRDIHLLGGHLPFGVYQYLPSDSRYITFLRDPVERTLSHYYRARSVRKRDPIPEDLSFEDVLAGGDYLYDNLQTRMLSGDPEPFGEVTQEMLEQAKENLSERFISFGLADRFDESLVLLKRSLELNSILYVSQRMTTNRPRTQESKEDLSTDRGALQHLRHRVVPLGLRAVRPEGRRPGRRLRCRARGAENRGLRWAGHGEPPGRLEAQPKPDVGGARSRPRRPARMGVPGRKGKRTRSEPAGRAPHAAEAGEREHRPAAGAQRGGRGGARDAGGRRSQEGEVKRETENGVGGTGGRSARARPNASSNCTGRSRSSRRRSETSPRTHVTCTSSASSSACARSQRRSSRRAPALHRHVLPQTAPPPRPNGGRHRPKGLRESPRWRRPVTAPPRGSPGHRNG